MEQDYVEDMDDLQMADNITDIVDAAAILAQREDVVSDMQEIIVEEECINDEVLQGEVILTRSGLVELPGEVILGRSGLEDEVESQGDKFVTEVVLEDESMVMGGEEIILGALEDRQIVMMDSDDVLLGNEDEVILGGEEIISGESHEDETEVLVPLTTADIDEEADEDEDEDEEEGKLIDSDDSDDSDAPQISDAGSAVISDVQSAEESAAPKINRGPRKTKLYAARKNTKRPPRNKKKKLYSQSPGSGASKLFLCPYCDMTGYNLELIHTHISESHPQSGKFKCAECTYASDIEYALDIHAVIHDSSSGAPPYVCTMCSFKCNMDFQLNKHINLHTGEKHFKCSQCDYGTDHTTNYRRHMERHSRTYGLSCHFCSYSCTNDYQLNKHIEQSHRDKVKSGQYRPKSIKTESKRAKVEPDDEDEKNMEDGDMAEEEDGLIRCKKCSFTTKYNSNMTKHMILHSGGTAEQMYCQLCSYTTRVYSNLKRHHKAAHADQPLGDRKSLSISRSSSGKLQSAHPTKRSFQMPTGVSLKRDHGGLMSCEACGYKTAWHTNLKRHYATHEPKVCTICSYSTMDRSLFVKHMRAHGSSTVGSDSDSASSTFQTDEYLCTLCNFTTSSKKKLRQHEQEHSSEGSGSGSTLATLAKSRERRVTSKRVDDDYLEGSDIDETFQEQKLISKRPSSRSSNMSSRNSLSVSSCHKTQDKLHCTQCDFSCNHDTWLETHMKQHAIGKTAHKCQYCGYTAPNPHRLKAHMMTHTGYKPYKCPRCDFASSNSSNLYRHIRKKHDPEDVELAKKQKVDIPESSDDEIEEVEPDDEDPPSPEESDEEKTTGDESRGRMPLVIYRCKECQYTTMSRESLAEHKEVHAIADMMEGGEDSSAEESSSESTSESPTHRPGDVIEEMVLSDNENIILTNEDVAYQHLTLPAPRQNSPSSPTQQTPPPTPPQQAPPTLSQTPPTPPQQTSSSPHKTPTLQSVVSKPSKSATPSPSNCLPANDRRGKLPVWKIKMTEWKVDSTAKAGIDTPPDSSFSTLPPRSPTSYTCSLCSYNNSLNAQVKLHHNRAHYRHQPYRCKLCVVRAQTMYQLNRHSLLSHDLRLRTLLLQSVSATCSGKAVRFRCQASVKFMCDRCGFSTVDKDSWGRHLNHHARDQIRRLQETSPRSLKRKEAFPSGLADNVFTCSECDFTCRRKDMYTAHTKQHGRKAAVSKCDQCPYTTSNPYNLMKHKRTHTGEKPFKCTYCVYRSADSGNLNKHINSHHGTEGAHKRSLLMLKKKKIKKTVGMGGLKPTESEAGEESTAPLAPGVKPPTLKLSSDSSSSSMMYKCTECEYKCTNEDFLIAHLSIHKKQGDQYVCAICEYTSRNQQNLAKHIRTHTGEKPYQCGECNYSAADKGNLNKHVKTHHRKDDMLDQSVCESHDEAAENITENTATSSTHDLSITSTS